MVYLQHNSPPPNKILTFSLRNFSGGINNNSELLEDNEAHNLLNMSFSENGIMEKRHGTDLYDEFKLDDPITSLFEFKPYDDVNHLLRASDKELYLADIKIRDLSGTLRYVNFNGKLFFIDGDKMYVYGKFPQEDSTYEKILGVAVDGYVVLEVVNPPEKYTPLGTEHTEGVTRYDYENEKVWYEPCKFEVEDTYMGANVLPESANYVVVHEGRLYVSGSDKDDDNVFITDVRNPYYYPVAQPIQLPPNSDKVKGLAVFDDGVVVGREHDMFVIRGKTANPELGFDVFTLERLNVHTGFLNQDSVVVAHNYLLYFASDGKAYALSSVNQPSRVLATTVISHQLDLFSTPFEFTKEDLDTMTTYFHDNHWYVSIKDKVLVYSYFYRAWTVYSGLDATCFYALDRELVWGTSSGETVQFTKEYLDRGDPYLAFWESKVFDMDDANSQKQFREFFIVAYTYDDFHSDIRVTFEVDYVDVRSEALVSNQVSRWGQAKWGDRFISRNIVASLPFVIGRRGRGIRFRFSNGYVPLGVVDTYADLLVYPGRKNGVLLWVEDESAYYLYYNREWSKMGDVNLNQPMKLYQVNGDYEFRGKR